LKSVSFILYSIGDVFFFIFSKRYFYVLQRQTVEEMRKDAYDHFTLKLQSVQLLFAQPGMKPPPLYCSPCLYGSHVYMVSLELLNDLINRIIE